MRNNIWLNVRRISRLLSRLSLSVSRQPYPLPPKSGSRTSAPSTSVSDRRELRRRRAERYPGRRRCPHSHRRGREHRSEGDLPRAQGHRSQGRNRLAAEDGSVLHGPLEVGDNLRVGERGVVFRCNVGEGAIIAGPVDENGVPELEIPDGTDIPDGAVITNQEELDGVLERQEQRQ